MPPRAMATATLSFGLVSIPVKLYASSESSEKVAFRMLHDKCKTPLKRPYFCPKDREMVDRGDIVKGYEYAKDNFVLFSDEEIKAVQEEVTRTVDIQEFVPLSALDPLYYDSAYFLGPDKGGDRPYKLLSIALEKTGLAGVAKYAARGKQYLVLVRPFQEGLVLQQLHYANEIRSFDEVPRDDSVKIKGAEVELALQLINQTAHKKLDFDKYQDEVKGRLQEVIAQKIEGQEVAIVPGTAPEAQVLDLMEALKKSLAAKGASPKATPGKKKTAKKTARKPAKAAPKKKTKASGSKAAKAAKAAKKRKTG